MSIMYHALRSQEEKKQADCSLFSGSLLHICENRHYNAIVNYLIIDVVVDDFSH